MSFNQLDLNDYRAIYENAPDGVLFTSPDGLTLAANPAACRMLRMTEEEVCRVGRAGVVDDSDEGWTWALAERESFGNVRAQLRMKRSDGSTFLADFTSAIFSREGGERRACVIFRDLGEMVDAIEQRAAVVEDLYFRQAARRAATADDATIPLH
jgi:PAS domain S-box-containing protein